MKYCLILETDGDFPGAPDRERIELNEEEYWILWEMWVKR